YSPVAKWLALVSAVGTGILYVALLVVLGLFIDLIVSRGEIPPFRNLSPNDQEALFQNWDSLSMEERKAHLQAMNADPALAGSNVRKTPDRQEVLWRVYVYHLLGERVSPAAADLVKGETANQPLLDLGILSLVVR